MKKFKELTEERKDSQSTLLNYITNSFVKLTRDEEADNKALFLLLGATIIATINDPTSSQLAKKLTQLALSKGIKNDQ